MERFCCQVLRWGTAAKSYVLSTFVKQSFDRISCVLSIKRYAVKGKNRPKTGRFYLVNIYSKEKISLRYSPFFAPYKQKSSRLVLMLLKRRHVRAGCH